MDTVTERPNLPTLRTTVNEALWFLRAAQAPRLRTIREFAESEIVIPDGPYENMLFKCSRQPYTQLWFDAVQSGIWNRHFAAGPTQSGKTLACYVIVMLWHLFEFGETVICGIPSMEMAADKWREDIKPAIEKSRYRDLMPTSGQGSKGGSFESITFKNGATLKFMSGGGNDKKRAGFTARVLVITEVDGMDEAGLKSREADKITQLEGRLRAYGKRKRVYGECTVSIEQGRTWREFTSGTASRLFLPCPHCKVYVHPTRENVVGWQGAENEHQAERESCLCCPECGEAWSESERRAANEAAKLVHRGQEIEADGTIHGQLPPTNTLGFRWDAVNNMFVTPGEVGAEEWKASRSSDEDNAEKEMRQFVWALPHEPAVVDSTPLEAAAIIGRMIEQPRGHIPPGTDFISVGVDVGKWLLHWVAVCFNKSGTLQHVHDYGRIEVASNELGEQRAILQALRELRDTMRAGWRITDTDSRSPDAVWVDSGYQSETVYAFIRESGRGYMASDGYGSGQEHHQHYNRPKTTGAVVKLIGDGYHFSAQPKSRLLLAEINADHWKSKVHESLTTPLGEPGALTLFKTSPADHLSFAKHVTAEKQVEEFAAGKGLVVKWIRERRQNHWLDSLYESLCAGHFLGVRLIREAKVGEPPPKHGKPSAPSSRPEAKQQSSPIDALLAQRPGGWIG